MFARVSSAAVFVFLMFTVFAAAAPWGSPPPPPPSQCNTGPIQCCNSVQSASSSPVSLLTGLLGIVLPDLNVLVGLSCSPIIGSGGSCTSQPVCCQNNNFNGLIVIGCSPINIVL